MKEEGRRPLYPESVTTNTGFQRRPTEDVFGRRTADPIEIQDALEQAYLARVREPKPPKGQRGKKSA